MIKLSILISSCTSFCVGIDIGTTSICAIAISPTNGEIGYCRVMENTAAVASMNSWEKKQDPLIIEKIIGELLSDVCDKLIVSSIGITGQMHGIMYLDDHGYPLSSLFTWQDGRASIGNPNACDLIYDKTGYRISTGFGFATHFSNLIHGIVPEGAAKICTIPDYIAYVLTGRKDLYSHLSNAASMGLYDFDKNQFDSIALTQLGISMDFVPKMAENRIQGYYKGIPVVVAIGDNQASFLGSVSKMESAALANFGTGGQISILTRESKMPQKQNLELRPIFDGRYLTCGCSLCGGKAYALLERFFSEYAKLCGKQRTTEYEVLNTLALEGIKNNNSLEVKTTFCGTRSNPHDLGAITDISEVNFTPEALAAGVVEGMAKELYQMFVTMPNQKIDRIVVSGNAAKKNPALVMAVEKIFNLPVFVPIHDEEAAFGAAIYGYSIAEKKEISKVLEATVHYL